MPLITTNASLSASAAARSSRPTLATASIRSSVGEIVTPSASAWNRTRLTSGMIAPRLRSSFPGGSPSRPGGELAAEAERHRVAGRGPRHQAHELGVLARGADPSRSARRRPPARPPSGGSRTTPWRGSGATRRARVRHSSNVRSQPSFGHPPQPVAGEHAVVVDADPAPDQAVVDVRAEPLEVGVDLGSASSGSAVA